VRWPATSCRPRAFSEKDGTFVNHAGLAQAIHRAAQTAAQLPHDGQVFLDLLERRGLCTRRPCAPSWPAMCPPVAALAEGDLGEHGVFLTAAHSVTSA